MRLESGYPCAQVFAPPDKDLICFEPMTAPADALRTGAFAVAAPGRPYRAAFTIAVDRTSASERIRRCSQTTR